MIQDTFLDLSDERFVVTYAVFGNLEDAKDTASKACVEQTIEFPPELIGDDDIRGKIFGRIESIESISPERHHIKISYANECTGFQLPQFMNVMYGNISLFPNMRVEHIQLNETLAKTFKGPRFGGDGLRSLFKRSSGPIFMSALKPQGLSSQQLAKQAHEFALGQLDFVKDDHGLANQPFSPFKERVKLCAAAVQEANAKTGGHCVYTPMISAPSEEIFESALYAKEQGAGALLVSPALIGFDLARRLAESDEIGLPIIGHPALMGSYVVSPTNGFSHYAMFGQMSRLIGMDASIYPNFGGRFSFSKDECRSIINGCLDDMNHFKTILPSPGGGMTFQNVPEMTEFYKDDVMYLMGGNLHKQGMALSDACKRLRALASNT